MIKVNIEERPYAFLKKPDKKIEKSQHGTDIDLAKANPELIDKPLNINGEDIKSDNPDRYKQHGFHFTADNCIACHACEASCSEKNDLPPHIAFRKVGIIEGGSWPNSTRMNISMACNHCEDPVCLKGCPTLAYTKHAEYGAVLQDPDICFGCGYCTWVCPYNAPVLDHEKGQVSKCNMCVDRLEVGLQPACVSSCLGNALSFGVIEDLPENRQEAETTMPGFPDPSISRPNIRFQQTKSVPGEFSRMDKVEIKYMREGIDKDFKPKVEDSQQPMMWGVEKLNSRENPLVIFTILTQMAVGGFLALFLLPFLDTNDGMAFSSIFQNKWVPISAVFLFLAMESLGLLLSTSHLGKPMRFYRGFNNLRHSWLSREALCVSIFFGLMGTYWLAVTATSFDSIPVGDYFSNATLTSIINISGWGTVIFSIASIYSMGMAYRIKARPHWNHWHTEVSFVATVLILGPLSLALITVLVNTITGSPIPINLFAPIGVLILAGAILQIIALVFHVKYLKAIGGEGSLSREKMLTDFGKTYIARYLSLALIAITALGLIFTNISGEMGLLVLLTFFLLASVHELAGRAMFYVLVIPTTMPGAFFWKNQAFEEHAKIGRAHV